MPGRPQLVTRPDFYRIGKVNPGVIPEWEVRADDAAALAAMPFRTDAEVSAYVVAEAEVYLRGWLWKWARQWGSRRAQRVDGTDARTRREMEDAWSSVLADELPPMLEAACADLRLRLTDGGGIGRLSEVVAIAPKHEAEVAGPAILRCVAIASGSKALRERRDNTSDREIAALGRTAHRLSLKARKQGEADEGPLELATLLCDLARTPRRPKRGGSRAAPDRDLAAMLVAVLGVPVGRPRDARGRRSPKPAHPSWGAYVRACNGAWPRIGALTATILDPAESLPVTNRRAVAFGRSLQQRLLKAADRLPR
jgi:hypothetical protein